MYTTFQEMPVWQKSLQISEKIYSISISLPKSEDYGLTSQIRRSANSISANIAEAFGRQSKKDKSHFYVIARGSAFETQSHLLYGQYVGYFDSIKVNDLLDIYNAIIYDLNRIIKSLKSN